MCIRDSIDGGANTGLFHPSHVYVDSLSQRSVNLHMAGPEGLRSGVRLGTVTIAVNIPNSTSSLLLVLHEQMIGSTSDVNLISCNQLREFGHQVHDTARKYGGKQCLEVFNSQISIPFQLRRALMCLTFRRPSAQELLHAPRVVLTSAE